MSYANHTPAPKLPAFRVVPLSGEEEEAQTGLNLVYLGAGVVVIGMLAWGLSRTKKP